MEPFKNLVIVIEMETMYVVGGKVLKNIFLLVKSEQGAHAGLIMS